MSAQSNGLFEKMAIVMKSLDSVTKRGKVQGRYGYDYMTKDDIYDAIRKQFGEVGIAMFFNIVSYEQTQVESASGAKGFHAVVQLRIVLGCKDTGEKMECSYFGEATDYGDKSVGKAASLGLKYFLINTFAISTGDDTDDEKEGSIEHTQSSQSNNHSNRQHRNAPSKQNGNTSSNDPNQFVDMAARRRKVLEGTTFEDMNEMMTWANSNGVNWDNSSADIIKYINEAMTLEKAQ